MFRKIYHGKTEISNIFFHNLTKNSCLPIPSVPPLPGAAEQIALQTVPPFPSVRRERTFSAPFFTLFLRAPLNYCANRAILSTDMIIY